MAFSCTKRKDGRLMKRVSVNGNIVTLYSNNVKDLEKQYIEKKSQANKGIYINDEGLTVGSWADKWIELYKSDKSDATLKMYKDTIRLYIKPYLGNIKLKNLKQSDIVVMLNELDKKGITRRKDYTFITIKQILQKAIENDYIYKNVADGIKIKKHKSPEKKALPNKVILKIKKLAETDFDAFMILFILCTGIRRGEVVPIQCNDIDLDNRLIIIDKAVYFCNNQPIIKATKTGHSRTVPILDLIYDNLKKFKETHKPTDYLFTNSRGEMMSETSMKRKLQHVLKLLNEDIKSTDNDEEIIFTYHQLRHTFACLLHKAKIDIKEAQSWTGHRTAQVLLDIYTHLDAEDKEVASQKFNQFANMNL